MSLEPELQTRASQLMLGKLSTADPADLPELVRYLAQNVEDSVALQAVQASPRATGFPRNNDS